MSGIEQDLAKNLDKRIRQAAFDYLTLCEVADLSMREAMPGLLSTLVYVTASIAQCSSKMKANDFAGACHKAFEMCESYEKKEKSRDRGE